MRVLLEKFHDLVRVLLFKTIDQVILDEIILEIVEEIVMLLVQM
jgi:hypothetical protein